jgi:cold shock CspA family protein
LASTQVGVTLATLGLGWAGEDTIYGMLLQTLQPVQTPATSTILHGVSFVLAFLVMTYAHAVIGEVVPKNLGIEKADRLASPVALALLVFARVSSPFVYIIERSSAAVSRVLGLRGGAHGMAGHSAEELKLIVSLSSGAGHLPPLQEDMIHRIIDLENLYVRQIMVPRNEIVSISVDASLDEVLHTMIEHQHSRLPVYRGTPEKIVGILYYKDLLPLWVKRRAAIAMGRRVPEFRVHRVMRSYMVAPETKLRVQVGQGQKGPQVTAVLELDASTAAATSPSMSPKMSGGRERPDPATASEIHGTVKWFNGQKGFGFIQPDNGGKDVFVHATALERAGMRGLAEGQKVRFDTQPDRRTGKIAVANIEAA